MVEFPVLVIRVAEADVLRDYLRLFRVINVPTVPGDILAGASAVIVCSDGVVAYDGFRLLAASLASVVVYLFGLVDNDIVGAATDTNRPIPEGKISVRAASIARGLCLFCALILGAVSSLPPLWWVASLLLVGMVSAYNRTRKCVLMGLCRGLNVLCGGVAMMSFPEDVPFHSWRVLGVIVFIWTAYIAGVTWYSEGEELDDSRKRTVGFLIGALVYLQLIAMLLFPVSQCLIAGAVLLISLRISKRLLPWVSAS